MIKSRAVVLSSLSLLLIVVLIVSCCVGAVSISAAEFFSLVGYKTGLSAAQLYSDQQAAVLLHIRLPRVALGALVGAALGVSGAAIQGLFRNPLAEPGLIGISSGATLFTVLMIVLGAGFFKVISGAMGFYALSISAFAGACFTTILVYRLAVNNGKTVITTLLLCGIGINALAGALTGLLTYMATDEQLRTITFWSLGSLGGASWETVILIAPFVFIPVFILPFFSKSLNALALGEAQAVHMGINVVKLKRVIMLLATIAVGASVSVAGMIGFIGLVVPHVLRISFTSDHRLVLPGAAIAGAALLTMADLVARTIVMPAELPIGILTALIGTPVFLYMVISERNKNKQL